MADNITEAREAFQARDATQEIPDASEDTPLDKQGIIAAFQREIQALRERLAGMDDQTQDQSHHKDQGMDY